jgi:DNA-binding response OmpR family regulator
MKKCVFVLEDNEELRELFTYILEEEAYQVFSYPNAKSFWESFAQHGTPDMIVLDVMLPDGNGLDICCELKKDPATKGVPIMIMSAHAEITDMKTKCDAEEFIAKPFDIHNFVEKVDRHLKA